MTSDHKPTIALAGATGRLGSHILSALLSPTFSPSYAAIIILVRPDSKSTIPAHFDSSTIQARVYDPANIAASLTDIDVLISAVGPTGHDFKDSLVSALADPSVNVKLYIPSEFGVDHTVHDFRHVEWDHKKAHFELTRQLLDSTKARVLRIFVGLFLEESIGPWFGFHTREGRYECIGSADAKVSYTSLDDAGKVVAQAARAEMVGVLEEIHVAGDTVSTREIAGLMEEAGGGEIEIKERDLGNWKEETLREGTSDPSKYLRFLMGEGKIDHRADGGLGCDNEVVNPGETVWKWKTMRDLAKETNGRPWADLEWDDKQIS
jgi:hypothetical protein